MYYWSKEEYEVCLVYDDYLNQWEAYTNIPKYKRKFEKQGWTLKKTDIQKGKEIAWTFIAPENGISIRNPNKKRVVTDEQREAASQRLKKARSGGS